MIHITVAGILKLNSGKKKCLKHSYKQFMGTCITYSILKIFNRIKAN